MFGLFFQYVHLFEYLFLEATIYIFFLHQYTILRRRLLNIRMKPRYITRAQDLPFATVTFLL